MKFPLSFLAAALAFSVLPPPLHGQGQAPSPAPIKSDLSQYTTADALWAHIQILQKGPTTRPPSTEEYRIAVTNLITRVSAATTEFLKRYPQDPRKWDARLIQIQMDNAMDRIYGRSDDAFAARQLQDLAGQKDAPVSVRSQARRDLLQLALQAHVQGDKSVTADDILAQLKQFAADFPGYPHFDVVKYQVAQALAITDTAAAMTLLKELAASGEGDIAVQARKQLAAADKLKDPLDLQFTAVDGSPVDISKMRGKVVLVTFWATWSPPCRSDVPQIVTAYNKLHAKGFEVVGISFDQDKEALLKFTSASDMPWPEYFDGKGWKNDIGFSFGIQTLPRMWLVNKKGYVVSTNARADLEGQVEKLLAE